MPNDTIVVYTTQTSATASIWRILGILNQGQLVAVDWGHRVASSHGAFVPRWEDIPRHDHLINCNLPSIIKGDLEPDNLRFFINFRDPRDFHCNAFQWEFSHEKTPPEPEDVKASRHAHLREIGIDAFVLRRIPNQNADHYFRTFLDTAERMPSDRSCVNTYARLCLDFDSFVERAASFMGVELTPQLREALEVERTDNIKANPHWIGNLWQGSDTLPGRYKRELKADTIELLNERHSPTLRRMAELDPDYASLYLENIPI